MDNTLFGNSSSPQLFDSKYLDPNFLFKQEVQIVKVVQNLDYPLIFSYYNGILFAFSVFFILIIAYTIVRLHELRKKEHEHLHNEIKEYAHHHAHKEKDTTESNIKNEKWKIVLQHLLSSNESDLKLAIIEADTMLDNLMTTLNFKGDNLGEKLKNADRDKFHSLSTAWEVHTIRNRIAHEGSNYVVTNREAKRVIALYEQIFYEFGYI